MNPTSKDIATIINAESSLAPVLGTDLYWSRMPPTPQDVTAVIDLSGEAGMLQLNKSRSDYYVTRVSVQCRAAVYETGYATALAIMKYLHGIHNMVIGDTYYSLIQAIEDPALLHYDHNDRPVFVTNYKIQRRFN